MMLFTQRGGCWGVLLPLGRRGLLCFYFLQVENFVGEATVTSSPSRLTVSKEPGPPGQPRVQDLRLENPEKGSASKQSGWQAVVSWDPGETPGGRTFTLQCCRSDCFSFQIPIKAGRPWLESRILVTTDVDPLIRLAEGGGEWSTVRSDLSDGLCLVDYLAPGQVDWLVGCCWSISVESDHPCVFLQHSKPCCWFGQHHTNFSHQHSLLLNQYSR